MTFIASPQQAAVIEWVANGRGSAFVEAVAGAGKTTTLIQAVAKTSGTVAFAAFNKKVADEIKAKVALLNLGNRVSVGTFHSFGFSAWRRAYPKVKVDARAKDDRTHRELGTHKALQNIVSKLISLAKQRGLGVFGAVEDDSLWYGIIDHFDLSYEVGNDDEGLDDASMERVVKLAQAGLRLHIAIAPELIDFDDMIYMPLVAGLRLWENDWIFVDEAQDTNPARRALARKMLKRNGRAVFVGDRHQAIYGFTGADNDAVDQIIREFRCTSLPLTITYRCPKAVVAAAQEYVSHIEAHPSAPEGSVGSITDKFLIKDVAPGLTADDAILCRKTAPLVSMAFALIRQGIACHVEGKDIGVGLLKLVNRWQVRDVEKLQERLEAFKEREMQKLIAKGRETAAEAVADRVETILVLMDGCPDVDCVRQKIAKLFLDSDGETRPTLTLSTVHKSKGREWHRVFVLGARQYMPSPWARQEWQQEQELNLIYVAYTRAQLELWLVDVEI